MFLCILRIKCRVVFIGMPIFQLSGELIFPPPRLANEDGLLAVGGDLTIERLLLAYQKGIFPWYNEGEPILWWTPNPRCVLFPSDFKVSKSLKQLIRKQKYNVTFDVSFSQVISSCKSITRKGQEGTWITQKVKNAYTELHRLGYAHSVEVWNESNKLVGGLYGLSLGSLFFGESMFSAEPNTSKIALYYLIEKVKAWGFELIDCQVHNQHLESLGASMISRHKFEQYLENGLNKKTKLNKWTFNLKQE